MYNPSIPAPMPSTSDLAAVLALFDDAGVAVTTGRFNRAYNAWVDLTTLERERVRFCIVPQSYDKQRFANRNKRAGRSVLIGSGGQHKGKKPYQIFMDWSEVKS